MKIFLFLFLAFLTASVRADAREDYDNLVLELEIIEGHLSDQTQADIIACFWFSPLADSALRRAFVNHVFSKTGQKTLKSALSSIFSHLRTVYAHRADANAKGFMLPSPQLLPLNVSESIIMIRLLQHLKFSLNISAEIQTRLILVSPGSFQPTKSDNLPHIQIEPFWLLKQFCPCCDKSLRLKLLRRN